MGAEEINSITLPQTTLVELRQKLGSHLVSADRVYAPTGIATGLSELDQFLMWKGLPKGALTLFQGAPGFGATALWTQSAAQVTQVGRWCAWLSHSHSQLNPWTLQRRGVNLKHLVVVSGPKDARQRLWALQELLTLSLFDLVACDLGTDGMSDRQLVQLRQLTARAQCAVLLFSQRSFSNLSRFALAVEFSARGVGIKRALHRLTPHFLPRRDSYADLMPQLKHTRAIRGGGDFPRL